MVRGLRPRPRQGGRPRPLLPQPLADLFPDRFEDSELGEIPEGWRVASLEQLFHDDEECVLTGPFGSNLHAHDYREDGVPLILVKHVVDGRIVGGRLARALGITSSPPGALPLANLGTSSLHVLVLSADLATSTPDVLDGLSRGEMLRVRVPDWSILHPRYLAQLFLGEDIY